MSKFRTIDGESRGVFSSNALKLIACVTMLIDHVGMVFFPHLIFMRCIGRIAMPIYCCGIATGAEKTHSRPKYLLRMAAFAVLSELPFDYALYGKLYWGYQNVMLTLTVGLLCIWGAAFIKEKIKHPIWVLPALAVFALGGAAAEFMKADYGYIGVAMIACFWFFENRPVLETLGLAFCAIVLYMIRTRTFTLPIEAYAVFAMIPIGLGNGKRGKGGKALQYALYAFYPVHLAVIALLHLYVFR